MVRLLARGFRSVHGFKPFIRTVAIAPTTKPPAPSTNPMRVSIVLHRLASRHTSISGSLQPIPDVPILHTQFWSGLIQAHRHRQPSYPRAFGSSCCSFSHAPHKSPQASETPLTSKRKESQPIDMSPDSSPASAATTGAGVEAGAKSKVSSPRRRLNLDAVPNFKTFLLRRDVSAPHFHCLWAPSLDVFSYLSSAIVFCFHSIFHFQISHPSLHSLFIPILVFTLSLLQVLNLYRQVFRMSRKLDPVQRREIRGFARHEFEIMRNVDDADQIKYLLSNGKRQLQVCQSVWTDRFFFVFGGRVLSMTCCHVHPNSGTWHPAHLKCGSDSFSSLLFSPHPPLQQLEEMALMAM